MYDVLKNYLTYGTYTLDDAKSRIDYGVAAGRITADQAAELLEIAAAHATRTPEIADKVAALETRVEGIEVAMNVLAGIDEPENPDVTHTTDETQEVQENV